MKAVKLIRAAAIFFKCVLQFNIASDLFMRKENRFHDETHKNMFVGVATSGTYYIETDITERSTIQKGFIFAFWYMKRDKVT